MAMVSKHIIPTLYTCLNYSPFPYTTLTKCLSSLNMPSSSSPSSIPIIPLLGPPEIHQQPPLIKPPQAEEKLKTDPLTSRNKPPMGLTENQSPTFLSSGNPCVDFFFHVVPDTPPKTLVQRLELAWEHDPLKALKLVCNLRGVRGTGKSDKEGAYTALLWLHNHHPKTLACNVETFAEFGYYKDLLEVLFRIIDGPYARKMKREMYEKGKKGRNRWRWKSNRSHEKKMDTAKNDESKSTEPPKLSPREEKRMERAKKVIERFNSDPDFKFLHDRVSDLFAEDLRSDMRVLNSGRESKKYTLTAKWCPSLYSSFDNIALLCETIARRVFPRDEYPEYQGVEEAHYAYRVRDRLRKQVLAPLRKALELPEVYIGANDWGSIKYNRVASVAMKLYTDKFFKHDKERFLAYLHDVGRGKAKIAAGALMPHELIRPLWDRNINVVAELQWNRLVKDMSEKGKLNNCLAICDVSGSMHGTPMNVSVALGMLVSELSEEPWKGKLITFSEKPELQTVVGDSLTAKKSFVERMDWDMNTDFQKVFDLLLQVAVDGKLSPEQMIKRLFVFSDMEFDQASLNPWETDYEAIVRKFNEKGYGDCVPEIVFWNLRDSKATPVPSNQPGVALVSGFSKNLMTLFLEEGGILDLPAEAEAEAETEAETGDGDGEEVKEKEKEKEETCVRKIDPVAVMEAAISGEEYEKLVVFD